MYSGDTSSSSTLTVPVAASLNLNEVLISFSTPNPGTNRVITSEISRCKCFVRAGIACQYPVDGNIFIDYFDQPNQFLYTQTIPLVGSPSVFADTIDIQSRFIRVRLVLDSDPLASTLSLFVSLKKKYV